MPYTKNISSNHILRIAEETLHCGFLQVDAAVTQWVISEGLRRLLGLPLIGSFVTSEHIEETIHPDDRGMFLDDAGLMRIGEIPPPRRLRVVRQDGTTRHVSLTFEALTNKEGLIQRFVGIVWDITQEEALLTARLTTHRQFEALKRGLRIDAIWIVSATGCVFDHSSTPFLRHRQDSDLRDLDWISTLDPDDRQRVRDEWTNCLAVKSELATWVKILCEDGDIRHYALRGYPLLNDGGDVTEWLVILIGDPRFGDRQRFKSLTLSVATERVDGAWMRSARGNVSWTLEELALHAGVSRTTVKRLEDTNDLLLRVAKRKTVEAIVSALADAGVTAISSFNDQLGLLYLPQKHQGLK